MISLKTHCAHTVRRGHSKRCQLFTPGGVVYFHYSECQLTAELNVQHCVTIFLSFFFFCISWPLLDLSFLFEGKVMCAAQIRYVRFLNVAVCVWWVVVIVLYWNLNRYNWSVVHLRLHTWCLLQNNQTDSPTYWTVVQSSHTSEFRTFNLQVCRK